MVTEPITLPTTQSSKYRKRRNSGGREGTREKNQFAEKLCKQRDQTVEFINLRVEFHKRKTTNRRKEEKVHRMNEQEQQNVDLSKISVPAMPLDFLLDTDMDTGPFW